MHMADCITQRILPDIHLRGQSASNDARGGFRNRRNVLDQDAQPSQLRGLVTLHLPKPTRIKSVELTLTGQGRTDWPEGEQRHEAH